MVTVDEKHDPTIQVNQLNDGQIGVITSWGTANQRSEYVGRVVQRLDDRIQQVGGRCGQCWRIDNLSEHCRVRVLQNGTTLIVEDNE